DLVASGDHAPWAKDQSRVMPVDGLGFRDGVHLVEPEDLSVAADRDLATTDHVEPSHPNVIADLERPDPEEHIAVGDDDVVVDLTSTSVDQGKADSDVVPDVVSEQARVAPSL